MILGKLEKIWKEVNEPFFKGCNGDQLFFNQLQKIITNKSSKTIITTMQIMMATTTVL